MNIKELSLTEKTSLCSGYDFWYTKKIDRVGMKSLLVSDGPNGVRVQEGVQDHLGINTSAKAVCFPSSAAMASSFDIKLLVEAGVRLGRECQAFGVSMLLGPGMNIKRSPLCGRNFEYYSEDPYLTAQMACAYIKGLESQGVGACVKHFAANNQETRRLTSNSIIDERTLFEIYLRAFKNVIMESKPKAVMCSYNQINGVYAAENKKLLTDILRKEWGFDGLVITDWGAIKDRVRGLEAGVDIEMPGGENAIKNDQKIVDAIREDRLDEKYLDTAVQRFLDFYEFATNNEDEKVKLDLEDDYKFAVETAKQCAVLLKNEGGVLPVSEKERILFIGGFVEKPRYQGSGSSHVNSFKVPSICELVEKESKIECVKGFSVDDDSIDDSLIKEAMIAATRSDKVVVFAGLSDRYEAEGMDRENMQLPENQNILIEKLANTGKTIIVVMYHGSPVEMPWVDKVEAILSMYLGGDGVSEATLDLLFGRTNPSGKLPETFPIKLEDNPSFLNFPGTDGVVEYREGIFVGYRYYEKKKQNVLYPFGHGLSYTNFEYKNLKISKNSITDREKLELSISIKNIGNVRGKETVQIYVGQKNPRIQRPIKELVAFEKIELDPAQEKKIVISLDRKAFEYYETKIHDFYVTTDEYEIYAGASSEDIRLVKTVHIESTGVLPMDITRQTTIGDLLENPVIKPELEKIILNMYTMAADHAANENQASIESMGEGAASMGLEMAYGMSFDSIIAFGAMTEEQVDKMIQHFTNLINEGK